MFNILLGNLDAKSIPICQFAGHFRLEIDESLESPAFSIAFEIRFDISCPATAYPVLPSTEALGVRNGLIV